MKFALLAFLLLGGCVACHHDPAWPDADLRRWADSTVKVESDQGSGSGTVIGKDLVLTCAHVVAPPKHTNIVVRAERAGWKWSLPAKIVSIDEEADLALLQTKGNLGLPVMNIALKDPKEYEMLYSVTSAMGFPRTGSQEVFTGIEEDGKWRLIGFALPGSSGGTVFNSRGELVCVVDAIWGDAMVECISRGEVLMFLAHSR